MTLQTTLDAIAPLGHTIIALSEAPAIGAETTAWIEHLNSVSDAIEQRPAILVIPFSDIDTATTFADQATVKTSYRVICVCYHGATGQEPEIAGAMAAALADSSDPALPFNGVNLGGVTAVDDSYKLTFERMERAMNAGVCMIQTGADGNPAPRDLSDDRCVGRTGSPVLDQSLFALCAAGEPVYAPAAGAVAALHSTARHDRSVAADRHSAAASGVALPLNDLVAGTPRGAFPDPAYPAGGQEDRSRRTARRCAQNPSGGTARRWQGQRGPHRVSR